MIKNKCFLLIIMIIFLTGCNVKENIIINKDLSVVEEVNMSGTKQFFDNRYKMLPKNIVKDILESSNRKQILIDNNYKYSFDELDKFPSIKATKNYSNIKDLTNNTIFKKQFFNTFTTNEKENLVTIIAKDFDKNKQYVFEKYSISNCQINIELPYKVVSNNADKYIAKTNTFIWYINDETEDKEIKITFDKSKIYVYNLSLYITLGIIIILIIIGIVIILKIIKQSKKANDI